MKKLYVDVTELYVWEGKVTGIIRVMDELAVRLADENKIAPTFVIWDEGKAVFLEVDFAELQIRRKYHQSSPQDLEAIDDVLPIYRAGIRIPFSRTMRRVMESPRKGRRRKSFSKKEVVNFKTGSLLFMPHGGVWGSAKYAAKVFKLQKDRGVHLVPILYDLCPVVSPQFCSRGVRRAFKKYMSKMLVKADMVLAISKNTAEDARKWVKSDGGKVASTRVFRLGDEIGYDDSVKPRGVQLPADFIICVGTVEARKNHAGLYYAYKLAKQKKINLPSVVIVGRKGWLAKDIYSVITKDPDVKNKFIFMHDASDNELAWLYEHAKLSVYPSFYEGWGLPVAESLLRGVPCLASNTSSIKEIGGDLIEYFSPYSPEEIMEKINALSGNPKLLVQKRKKIKAGYKATSWDDSYREVLTALKEV